LTVGGQPKAFHLHTPMSPLNDISFTKATEVLRDGMADLPDLLEETRNGENQLLAMGLDGPAFTVELDNEFEQRPGELEDQSAADLLAAPVPMLTSVELDSPEVGVPGYGELLERQANIEKDLKRRLRDAYGT
jgi:hypothetical protein